MPRYARSTPPGAYHHVVSRFIARERILTTDALRADYLCPVGDVLAATDWVPIAYALMSTHVHWVLRAGTAPSCRFVQPLHGGFARRYNRANARIGPVFADRHRTITLGGAAALARVVAYVHNNPVRAGLVRDAIDSSWTTHRAFLGLAPAPPWLDVEAALVACGFDASPSGRLAFHEFVRARAADPRDASLSGEGAARGRARVRTLVGGSVEVSTPTVTLATDVPTATSTTVALVTRRDVTLRPRWDGPVLEVLDAVSAHTGISVARLCSRERSRRVTAARRLALWSWTEWLGRPQNELGAMLGRAASSCSELRRSVPIRHADLDNAAAQIACVCRGLGK